MNRVRLVLSWISVEQRHQIVFDPQKKDNFGRFAGFPFRVALLHLVSVGSNYKSGSTALVWPWSTAPPADPIHALIHTHAHPLRLLPWM
ncbi:unnamed protein product [Soboliphyme baturini]|uniref:Uncharacterized protein n=1 Tax=Soboliphyme baturini TaxID=241478 RepID=A0A183JA81_9BILA|nr:unnamed protein product [Soboliphyme baturini]